MKTEIRNPLLVESEHPFAAPDFPAIQTEHYLPALQEAIEQAKVEIEAIAQNPATPDFFNTIEALERAGKQVNRIASVLFNLNSAETNESLQAVAREASPLLAAYANDIMLHEQLFARIRYVWEHRHKTQLTAEQQMLLTQTYRQFVRNGALLSEADKAILRQIDEEKARLSVQFGENVLKETNDFILVLESEEELAGLPAWAVEAARQEAAKRNMSDKWVITLQAPSFMPFMQYAQRRELREKLYRAYASRAYRNNEHNNVEIARRIAELRVQRARLLGYPTHAHFVLEERMAQTPERVQAFLDELAQKAKPVAIRQMSELEKFAETQGFEGQLQRWDISFYAEKLKKHLFDIDDDRLKPYFPLPQVLAAAFEVAGRLYGISFQQRTDIPVYHEEVEVYEVLDHDGTHLGLLYADFHPREGKRSGAWMTTFREQYKEEGKRISPLVSIVCNFTRPTQDKPSLLTFNEVTTLFHEFGHALHALLSDVTYESLSGTNVYWDFVELPSQIMENWCYEAECLALFAKHYETGETLPMEYIEKIKALGKFMEGYQTLRQLSFGYLDMAWHAVEQAPMFDKLEHFEREVLTTVDLLPPVEGTAISTAFSHIFSGGYSAGYYSYKWAEVLDADAFALFQEKGIFDRHTGLAFRRLLAAGGSRHPMELYKEFRGHEPSVEPLLRRAGLLE